ncbi:hypothetical protein C9374_005821 [Naegleria lovaniensis]|uniref:Adenylate kinase n=1 Tax=Naegleria lovaniensis TaxID=51637 RepID=A0AA88GN45_NAELO|nr:uncharacterized protein C9374_005821 [Naegleria lovaniensis]KAG2382029.1 hypothetical protein C9374_005821 [Naegleria lovaniensis]
MAESNDSATHPSSAPLFEWEFQKVERKLDLIIGALWKVVKKESVDVEYISLEEMNELTARIIQSFNNKNRQQFQLIFPVIMSRITKQSSKILYDNFFGFCERFAFFCTLVWNKAVWSNLLGRLLLSIVKNGVTCPQPKRREKYIQKLLNDGKIHSEEISDVDLVYILNTLNIDQQVEEQVGHHEDHEKLAEALESLLHSSSDSWELKHTNEIHSLISFNSPLDLETLLNIKGKPKSSQQQQIKFIDKYFERLLRLSFREGDETIFPSVSELCYDSEDEMILDVNKKPKSFLILGESFSGKSSIAKKMSQHFNCVRLDIQEMAKEEFMSKSEMGLTIEKCLREERNIPNSVMIDILKKWLTSDSVIERGYTLEWGSILGHDIRTEITKSLEEYPPKYVLNLEIEPKEKATRNQEMVSRISKRIAELEKQIEEEDEKERKELEDERRKQELKEEKKRLLETQKLNKLHQEQDENNEDEESKENQEQDEHNEQAAEDLPKEEEEEEEQPAEEDEETKLEREKQKAIERQTKFMERLEYFYLKRKISNDVRVDTDSLENIIQNAKAHSKFISSNTSSQSLNDVFFNILQKIVRASPNVLAKSSSLPTENPEEEEDPQAQISAALEKGYKWSSWKKYCPVRFQVDRAIVEGLFPVLFRGRVYLLSTKEYQKEFITNPSYYLRRRPQKNQRVIFIWNGEEGKEVYEEVVKHYNVECTSLETYCNYVKTIPQTPKQEKPKKQESSTDENEENVEPAAEAENSAPLEHSEDIAKSIFVHAGSDSNHLEHLKHLIESPCESIATCVVVIKKEAQEETADEQNGEQEDGEQPEKSEQPPPQKEQVIDFVKYVKEKEEQLASKKIKIIDISLTSTWEGAFNIRKQIDPFYSEAVVVSGVEIPKEDSIFEREEATTQSEETATIEEGNKDEEIDDEPKPVPELRQRVLGYSGLFCPVTLKEKKMLVKGDSSLCVSYKNKHYFFDNQECVDRFIVRPDYYTRHMDLSSLNIWILSAGDQIAFGERLSNLTKLPVIKLEESFIESEGSKYESVNKYIQELERPVEKPTKPEKDEDEEANQEDEENNEEEVEEDEAAKLEKKLRRMCNIFKLILQEEKYAHGYILTSIPLGEHTEQILNILDEMGIVPTVILNFKVSEEHLVKSRFEQDYSEYKKMVLERKVKKRKEAEKDKIERRLKKKKQETEDEEEGKEENTQEEVVKTKEEIMEEAQKSYTDSVEKIEEIISRYQGKRFVVRDVDSTKPERLFQKTLEDFIKLFIDRNPLFDFVAPCTHEIAMNLIHEGKKKLGYYYFDKVERVIQSDGFPKIQQHFLTFTHSEDEYIVKPPPKEEPPQVVTRPQVEEPTNNEENQDDNEENEEQPAEEKDDKDDGAQEEAVEEEENKKKQREPPKPELSFPVVVNHRVFFFITEKSRDVFMKNRKFYMECTFDDHAFRPKVLILGTDQEKRQSVAKKVAENLGCVYIDVNEIVNTFKQYDTMLGQHLRSMQDEEELDHLVELLKLRVQHFDCQVKGYVIDGIYLSFEDVKELSKRGELIDKVFFLHNDNEMFTQEERQIETLFEIERPFTTCRLGILPEWLLVSNIQRAVTSTLSRQYLFHMKTQMELAAPIHDIGLTNSFFTEHLSKFKTYCPVKFVEEGILCDTIADRSHLHRCLYSQRIYCMNDHTALEMFMSNPERFSSHEEEFPSDLPREVNDLVLKGADAIREEEYDDEIAYKFEYKGFCPILLSMGIIMWGKSVHSIEYKGKLFRTYSSEGRTKFMQTPWKYLNLPLPSKLPIRQRDWPNLGVVEYLEESVAAVLSNSVLELAKIRPLYRGLSVKDSALKHLALLLKRNNNANKRIVNKH